MKIILKGGQRTGKVRMPSSKSQLHRLLICAALGKSPVRIKFNGLSRDISATIDCLNALGANISIDVFGEINVKPIDKISDKVCILNCGESGSTLRFLLPMVGILGAKAILKMEGRLSKRPLSPFDSELLSHGMIINKDGTNLLCEGRLKNGTYSLPGNISSQYISGLLMVLPQLVGNSEIKIYNQIESVGYIKMTENVLMQSNIKFEKSDNGYYIFGSQKCSLPEYCQAEGDFSSAAFFLCIGAMSKQGIEVEGISLDSVQGDRKITDVLRQFGVQIIESNSKIIARYNSLHGIIIDASQIPDLIPVVSVLAAISEGETRIINAQRLRLKESDRIESTAMMLRVLGVEVKTYTDSIIIYGRKKLLGGTIDSCGDHRIAMAAAVASCASESSVIIKNMECVEKSYPKFWEDFLNLREVET